MAAVKEGTTGGRRSGGATLGRRVSPPPLGRTVGHPGTSDPEVWIWIFALLLSHYVL